MPFSFLSLSILELSATSRQSINYWNNFVASGFRKYFNLKTHSAYPYPTRQMQIVAGNACARQKQDGAKRLPHLKPKLH